MKDGDVKKSDPSRNDKRVTAATDVADDAEMRMIKLRAKMGDSADGTDGIRREITLNNATKRSQF
jgi:hypothetical protein